MIPTVEQLRFLNSLLSLLANDYVAKVNEVVGETQNVVTTFQLGTYERRLELGITIDPSEEDDGKWTVNTTVTSGGSREYPPDVDLVELEGPCSWEQACAALVRTIMNQLLDEALVAAGEAKFAKEEEDLEDFDFDAYLSGLDAAE